MRALIRLWRCSLNLKRFGIPLAFTFLFAAAASAQSFHMPNVPAGYARPHFRVHEPSVPPQPAAPIQLTTPTGLFPAQVKHLYDFDGAGIDGKGQTIAVVDAFDDPNIEADLGVFDAQFGLPACTTANGCFKKVYADSNGNVTATAPPPDSGWSLEISLDVEWAHAIAPRAKIMLVEGQSNSFNDLFSAIFVAYTNGANFVSMSWGGGEFPEETQVDPFFQVPGVTFIASSGDSAFGVQYPAVSPYVIGVGGTTLETNPAAVYLGETAWSDGGGGISQFEPEPLFQSFFGLPHDPHHLRGVPDVAYDGDPVTGVALYDSVPYQGFYGWFQVGGTSAGAPQWSAILADVDSIRVEKKRPPLAYTNGGAAFALYVAAGRGARTFHDISIGTNGLCGAQCLAAEGYDYITGLGTPSVGELVEALTERF